jgi:hypothetical protein
MSSKKPSPNVISSTTNTIWTGMGWNPGPLGERPPTDYLEVRPSSYAKRHEFQTEFNAFRTIHYKSVAGMEDVEAKS